MAYVANLLVMVAIALLYRYADFVTLLGGTEFHLGWIVGVGMVGSLLMRLLLGTGIDRYGPRRVWLCSLIVFAAVCFAHLSITRYDTPAIYVLRVLFCLALAGIFGSSMTFISGRVPLVRMAEMVGMLGTSGFVGMVLGTQLGDLLCGTQSLQRWQIDRMFLVAGALGTCAVVFAGLATRGLPRPQARRHPPIARLLRRYQPGTVLLVGVALGAGLGLPATFLRTYAAELGIARIGLFFAVYAPTAIATRVLTRRLPERVGLAPMILLGLGLLAVTQLLFLPVRSEWMFLVPGIGYGIAHAILFPAMVAAGTRFFPEQYRGLGMMLTLSAYDLGQLTGAPTAGAILHYSVRLGLPSYPTLFVSMAAALALVATVYALSCRPAKHPLPRSTVARPGHRLPVADETPAPEVSTSA
jgi:MFS family permease